MLHSRMFWEQMEMSKAIDIRSKEFAAADKVMLDANIWLILQGPQGNPFDYRTKTYSQALANMIAAKCQIIVDALVVSEFVNAYARLEFNLKKQPGDDFKRFRNSSEFKPIAIDIANEVKSILKISHPIESGFSTLNHNHLADEFSGGDSDFNDLIIAEICRANNYYLVTHDGDFGMTDLPVLTLNRKLLNI